MFEGSAVAIVTPFHEDGSVNYEKLAELIEFQISSGTDAIVICGTTGESATMTVEEDMKSIEFTVRQVAGRVPVIAGAGSNNTQTAIETSRHAESVGADALLLVTPYYNKTTQRGLVRHYTAIAESVTIPIILYNVPSRTGLNITPETCEQLAKIPNIVAIKEASGNLSQVAQIAARCGDELAIYSGNDDQILPVLSLGGKGVISVLANILPRETHEICELFFDGKVAESTKMQLDYLDLINTLFIEVNPIPVKEAMNLMGMGAGPLRLPLCEMSEANHAVLKACLERHGLLK
ncbi:4-hydroxy-tetrahydrodipicolinate synthase [Feifania hominis]|uniref:4-hydroxy-tetrahydrodipicolinate synthase n=1 Tax=Feifania hominis TaxID=2763660 RepID=UPI0020163E3C